MLLIAALILITTVWGQGEFYKTFMYSLKMGDWLHIPALASAYQLLLASLMMCMYQTESIMINTSLP